MTIAFFTNFISHHQVLVADELYKLTNGNYFFVQMIPMPVEYKKNGYPDFSSRPYIVHAWKNKENLKIARELALSVDVMLIGGSESLPFEILRCRKTNKLTLELSERWFKRGFINILSPRLLKWLWYYHTLFAKRKVYKLCCSAYTARDMKYLHAMTNRCFKWGYFTKVEDGSNFVSEDKNTDTTKMMWCSRFVRWKHPEIPVMMSVLLKEKGHKFFIDMYGSGSEKAKTEQLVNKYHVEDIIRFKGNLPNDEILNEMRNHDIFLFTSDKNEGWGAVANEAMSNGCVLVASDEIGSTNYLIEDGKNGFVFKSEDVTSLTEKVEWLISHPYEREIMSHKGYDTIRNIWSPQNASKNLMQLIDDLQHNRDVSIKEGPCSVAKIL